MEVEPLEMRLQGQITKDFICFAMGFGSYPESKGGQKGSRKGFEAGMGFEVGVWWHDYICVLATTLASGVKWMRRGYLEGQPGGCKARGKRPG